MQHTSLCSGDYEAAMLSVIACHWQCLSHGIVDEMCVPTASVHPVKRVSIVYIYIYSVCMYVCVCAHVHIFSHHPFTEVISI